MSARRLARAVAALAIALSASLALAVPASAQAPAAPTGERSLATVLAADGNGFDRNPLDFDILDKAVTTVLAAKPGSAVGVLADGSTALTAFLPTDQAFRSLAFELTGHRHLSEPAVFNALAQALGVDTIESVLLYHVVPGATITYRQALQSDGAALTTAAGSEITVDVIHPVFVQIVDADTNDRNATVVRKDINRGNLQIAHGISQVLRPVDLP